MNKKYTIGEIALDEGGKFWVTYYGDVATQGGMTWGRGQVGVASLEDAQIYLQYKIETYIMDYVNEIEYKRSLDDEDL